VMPPQGKFDSLLNRFSVPLFPKPQHAGEIQRHSDTMISATNPAARP
jgi:hypothetical protein